MNSETEAGHLQVEKESDANTTGVPKSRIFLGKSRLILWSYCICILKLSLNKKVCGHSGPIYKDLDWLRQKTCKCPCAWFMRFVNYSLQSGKWCIWTRGQRVYLRFRFISKLVSFTEMGTFCSMACFISKFLEVKAWFSTLLENQKNDFLASIVMFWDATYSLVAYVSNLVIGYDVDNLKKLHLA